MKEQWRYTRGEYEIDDVGNKKLKKVTTEKEFVYGKWSKERWLFLFQIIGSSGILLSIATIFFNINAQQKQINEQRKQQEDQFKSQIQQQKALFEIAIFSKAIGAMSILTNRSIEDTAFYRGANQIMNEVRPNFLLLFKKKNLSSDELINNINVFDTLLKERIYFYALVDSIHSEAEISKELMTLYNKYESQRQIPESDIMYVYRIYQRTYNLNEFFRTTSIDWKNYASYYKRTLQVASIGNLYNHIELKLDTIRMSAKKLATYVFTLNTEQRFSKNFQKQIDTADTDFSSGSGIRAFIDTCAYINRSITDSMRPLREKLITKMQETNIVLQ